MERERESFASTASAAGHPNQAGNKDVESRETIW